MSAPDAAAPHPDPSVELVRAISEHLQSDLDWTSWSVVIGLAGGRMSGTEAWAYAADGTVAPSLVRPSRLIPALETYLAWRYPAGEALPLKLLVQHDRTSGRYAMDFEESDPMRWKVTPDTFEEVPRQLRPSLG